MKDSIWDYNCMCRDFLLRIETKHSDKCLQGNIHNSALCFTAHEQVLQWLLWQLLGIFSCFCYDVVAFHALRKNANLTLCGKDHAMHILLGVSRNHQLWYDLQELTKATEKQVFLQILEILKQIPINQIHVYLYVFIKVCELRLPLIQWFS